MSRELTADELITYAETLGQRVTRSSLTRWYRAALLPRPRQVGLGRGKGSVALYPAWAASRVVAICEVRSRCPHDLAKLGWLLWWDRHPYATTLGRAYLHRRLRQWEEELAEVGAGGQITEEAQDRLSDLRDAPLTDRSLNWPRRRVGSDDFDLFAEGLLTAFTNGCDDLSDEICALLERGLGLDRAKSDRMIGGEPWLPEDLDVVADISRAGEIVAPSRLRAVLDTSADSALESARDDAQAIAANLAQAGHMLRDTLGRWAFGLGALGEFVEDGLADAPGQSLLVVQLLSLRDAGYGHQIDAVIAAREQLEQGRTALAALRAIGREFPDFAALSPERIGRALVDPAAQDELLAAATELRQKHGPEIDRLLSAPRDSPPPSQAPKA